jgi:hypothetical protein
MRHFKPFLANPKLESNIKIKVEYDFNINDVRMIDNLYPAQLLQIFPNGYIATVDEIEKELTTLAEMSSDQDFWLALSEEEKTSFESYRFSLMKSIQDTIQEVHHLPQKVIEKPIEAPSSYRWILFGALMALELVPMLWGGFLGLTELFSTIPWLSSFAISTVSLLMCGVESFLFYAVMSPLLKEALGLSALNVSTPRMEVYAKQHRLLNHLDKIMTTDNKMNAAEYKQYARLTNLLGEHMVDVGDTKIVKFEESNFKKGIRSVLSGLTTLLNIAGGYFTGVALLSGMAATAALIGTPIGWGIIGLVILGQIGLRLAVRSNAMIYTLNPGSEQYVAITDDINKFEPNSQKYADILSEKRLIEQTKSELNDREYSAEIMKSPYVDSFYRASKVSYGFFDNQADAEPVIINDAAVNDSFDDEEEEKMAPLEKLIGYQKVF